MNTYRKYVPNVFLAKCKEPHEKGDKIPVANKYGKENECIVFNLITKDDEHYYYSIVRADGFNTQEWAKRKADRLQNAAINADKKSDSYQNASNKDRDFLILGEPIKIGHHSEGRHRRIIEQAQNNTRKSIELSEKSDNYRRRAEYWESKANTINLSMPESIEYYEFKFEEAKARHEGLKNGSIKREHSFSLSYAKKELNDIKEFLNLANRLWGGG